MEGLKDIVMQEYAYILALRREFHQHPEKALEEFRTAGRIEEELDQMHIPHQRMGETGVFGILRGEKDSSKKILLRADIDALPIQEMNDISYCSQNAGVMHACGHDAHTACLLGAAKILSQNRGQLCGEIRLVFQPAEEIGHGTKPFLESGVLEGVSRVFGIHTAPDLSAGIIGLKKGLNNASVDHFKLSVCGKSAHVSSPQLGIDALYIASQIVVALQGLITRRISPTDPIILGIGKLSAGTAYNAVAESAILEGTTRTISQEMRQWIKEQINQISQNIAACYGGSTEIVWTHYTAPLVNDAEATEEAIAFMGEIWGKEKIETNRPLSLGGDNFADFIQEVPGVYAYLGTGNPNLADTLYPAHSSHFNIDEEVLPLGAGLYVAYAFHYMG